MKLRLTARSISQSSSLALAVALAMPAIVALPGAAYAQGAEQSFNIPAGDLAGALQAFSAQTGMQLVYSSDLVAGKRSSGVSGTLSAQEALQQLLAGTGLSARISGNTATLVAIGGAGDVAPTDGERVLGAVRVEGSQDGSYFGAPVRGEGLARLGGERGGQANEARGFRPVVATVGGGAPTAIEDIPRSVSVLTQDQMKALDITDIGEALTRLPGVTILENGSGSPNMDDPGQSPVQSRGFDVTKVQIDGGAARNLDIIDGGMLNIAAYERVELVRGPNGVFAGSGSPGGTLNLIRKRPGDAPVRELSVTLGSFDRAQAQFDFSTPSIGASDIAFRAVGSYENTAFHYAGVKKKSWLLYGITDIPLGERARLEVGASHSELRSDGNYNGVPRYADGPLVDVPFGWNYIPEWTYQNVVSSEIFSRFYANLGERFNLELGATFTDTSQRRREHEFSEFPFLSNGQTSYPGATAFVNFPEYSGHNQQISLDAKLTGSFDTFGLSHSFYIGADYNQYIGPLGLTRTYSVFPDGYLIFTNANQLIAGNYPELPLSTLVVESPSTSVNYGFVISDVISWRDIVDLTLSVRNSNRETSSYQIFSENGQVQGISLDENRLGQRRVRSEWLPTYALAIKPLKGLSVYASLANGSRSSDQAYTKEGQLVAPVLFESLEAGVKYGTADWLLTVNAYQTTETNIPTLALPLQFNCLPTGHDLCYMSGEGGFKRARGVEVEFNGKLFNQLGVVASYSYFKDKTISPNASLATFTPSSEAKILLDWAPPSISDWHFQFAARYRNKVSVSGYTGVFLPDGSYAGTIPFEYEDPARLIVDAGFQYALADNLTLSALVENIGNVHYFSTTSMAGNFIGRPRAYTVTLRWRDVGERRSGDGLGDLVPFGAAKDWYGALDLGAHSAGDLKGRSLTPGADGGRVSWDFETAPSLAAFGRVGYRFAPVWRAELEVGYRGSEFTRIGGEGMVQTGVCGAYQDAATCPDPIGGVDMWSVMANVIHDFGDEDRGFRPYVGAGAGFGLSSVDFMGRMENVTGPSTQISDYAIGANDSRMVFALQALAGFSYRLSDHAILDATYRYFNAPAGLRADSYNATTYVPNLHGFETGYSDHSLTIGLRWSFQ